MTSPYYNLVPAQRSDMTEKPTKPIKDSRTFWVNLVTAVTAVLVTLSNSELIQNNPEVAGIFVTAIAVANIVLRVVTTKPVTLK
ncbi:MAG: hypothetical protein ACW99J_19070 [Candidatus Thorarchaeota archaeon]|jgi:hypothetical protein